MKLVILKKNKQELGLFLKLNKGFVRIPKEIEKIDYDECVEAEIDYLDNVKIKEMPNYIR